MNRTDFFHDLSDTLYILKLCLYTYILEVVIIDIDHTFYRSNQVCNDNFDYYDVLSNRILINYQNHNLINFGHSPHNIHQENQE